MLAMKKTIPLFIVTEPMCGKMKQNLTSQMPITMLKLERLQEESITQVMMEVESITHIMLEDK
jgi:hypothetical protein